MRQASFDREFLVSPLTFDRVNDGHPITSKFPIFRLPVELLSSVACHIPYSDLLSLALVDRDCRQLARSVQFANVQIDRTDTACLLAHLAQEKPKGADHSYPPTIKSCIRRLVIKAAHHDVLDEHVIGSNCPDAYEHCLCAVIENAHNLHFLEWDTPSVMTSDLLDCIVASSIKHLIFGRMRVEHGLKVGLPAAHEYWNLHTLVVSKSKWFDADAWSMIKGILVLAAPNLRHLVWAQNQPQKTEKRGQIPFGEQEVPHFLNLRSVLLNHVSVNAVLLDALLGKTPRLRSLSVDSDALDYLASHGCIPTLESFHWINQDTTAHAAAAVLQFLQANTQLESFTTSNSFPSAFLDTYILPQLGDPVCGFHNLTSLRLSWDSRTIPEDSLHTLGTSLSWLKHLWLSSGSGGARHDWQISHSILLDKLSPLRLLETLVFSRDAYVVRGHPLLNSSIEGYYTNAVLPQDVKFETYLEEGELMQLEDAGKSVERFDELLTLREKMAACAWERWHRACMMVFAEGYAACFGKLEWCYIGQLPMYVGGAGGEARKICVESEERDRFSVALYKRWGISDDYF